MNWYYVPIYWSWIDFNPISEAIGRKKLTDKYELYPEHLCRFISMVHEIIFNIGDYRYTRTPAA